MTSSPAALGLSALVGLVACGAAPGLEAEEPAETTPPVASTILQGSTPEGSTPEGSTPEGSTPEGSAPEGSATPDPRAVAECEPRGREAKAAGDPRAAAVAYRAGCDGDSGRCCELLAQIEPGDLLPKAERTELHAKACELDDVAGCLNGGQRFQNSDPARASRYLVKGCGMLLDKDPIDETALSFMCGFPLRNLTDKGEHAAARPLAELLCTDRVRLGCADLAAMGGAPAPDPADPQPEDPPASSPALTVDGANLTMNQLSADGLTLHDVACRTSGSAVGTLLMGPLLAGSLAKKKALLSQCGKKGERVRARWETKGGRIAEVETPGHSPGEICVQKVLRTTVAPFGGTCAADIEIP